MTTLTQTLTMLREKGLVHTARRSLNWVNRKVNPFRKKPAQPDINLDVTSVDWTQPRPFAPQSPVDANGVLKIGWIISPPSRNSGGHQNAYRFMKYLEDAGYELNLIIYAPGVDVDLEDLTEMIASNGGYPALQATYSIYNQKVGVEGNYDLIVATDWATTYAAWRYERDIPRFYFVQDFEPYFYARGSEYVLAENSYRLGFHGVTVGPWLSEKLNREYGMPADSCDFAVDTSKYPRTNDSRRNEVVFYARPSTARRATEFGLMVLKAVAERRPDIVINLAGADMSNEGLDFEFVNHGALDVSELGSLYNRCAVGFSLSMTNASLFPLEVMSCGAVPIVNDSEGIRASLRNNPDVEFVQMSPGLMADRIIAAVDRPDQIEHSRTISARVAGVTWEDSGQAVVRIFDNVMNRSVRRDS